MVLSVKEFRFPFLMASLAMVLGSCNGVNIDPIVEQSCSSADGLWTVVEATCNGSRVAEINPVTYLFDPDSQSISQTTGRVDCATHFDWLIEVGEDTPIFSMTGSGNLSCTQSGQDTNFCSSEVNTCNAGIDITGIRNEFPTCVITADGMSLIRTVSAVNNPDNLSYCSGGQTETVTLRQGDYTPPIPEPDPEDLVAFLKVQGPNPFDFGTHPVGARITQTLTVTNSGNAEATGITATGLASPFLFVGGEYPGVGGTCSDILDSASSCTLNIEFFPLLARYYTDSLKIGYSNGLGKVAIDHGLAATASERLAQLTISDGPFYNFGNIEVGTSARKNFRVTNTGGGDAIAITEVGIAPPFAYAGGAAYPGNGGDCGTILLAGESCLVVIEFTPLSDGPFNDIIELLYLDGVNNQQSRRNIFGQGIITNP